MKKCILFTLLCALALPLFAACGDPAGSESAASSSAPSASSGDESEPFVENELIAQLNRYLSEEVDRTLPCTNILKGLSYTASKEPNADYADNTSAPKLTDGVTTDLFDKYNWLGFSGAAAFTIDFDLGEGHDQAIADISVGCLRQLDYGIGLPASVSVLVSDDGEQYTEIGKLYTPTGLDSSDKHVYNFCFPKGDDGALHPHFVRQLGEILPLHRRNQRLRLFGGRRRPQRGPGRPSRRARTSTITRWTSRPRSRIPARTTPTIPPARIWRGWRAWTFKSSSSVRSSRARWKPIRPPRTNLCSSTARR